VDIAGLPSASVSAMYTTKIDNAGSCQALHGRCCTHATDQIG